MIAWFATKGSGTNEAARMEALLSEFPARREWVFDKQAKRRSFWKLLHRLKYERPKLIVMEGTGIAGGFICLLGRWVWRVPYVFSSGDAIGPFIRAHHRWLGWLFEIYERILCLWCAGFIGWTPYLCGRALTFGAKRAVTSAGWAWENPATDRAGNREKFRKQWGIPESHLVFGIVGAIEWNSQRQYCYGWDLVQTAHRIARDDISFLIVGGGSGLERLRIAAGELLGRRIFLPGSVPQADVLAVLSAMDVGSLPQSVDGVGVFRYSTKLSEYVHARLPVVTTRIPMAYDLGGNWIWRLRGDAPWSEDFLDDLRRLAESLTRETVEERQRMMPAAFETFGREDQVGRVTRFIQDILEEGRVSRPEALREQLKRAHG